MSSSFVRIIGTPEVSLADDVMHFLVTGLQPRQLMTIAALLIDEEKAFVSHAFYSADEFGTVDIEKEPSRGGSYTGVEPMGLIWSMKLSTELRQGLRWYKNDVSTPVLYHIFVIEGHKPVLSKNDLLGSIYLAKTTLQRYYQRPGVTAIQIKTGRIRGTLFLPQGVGPFPGVIDTYGGIGGLIKVRAALLASKGFAALALAYFNYDDLPKEPIIHMEYFEEAIEFMNNHPSIARSGLGIVGICKSGTLAIDLAIISQKIKAVVAINPSSFRHFGTQYYRGLKQNMITWTPEELILPKTRTEEGYSFKSLFDDSVISRMEEIDAALKIENANAQFLLIFSEDDHSNSYSNLKYITDRLKKFGKTNYTALSYPGAGHLIEVPNTPHCRASYNALFGAVTMWGGEAKQHAIAQDDSWNKIIKFLHQQLDDSPIQKSKI